MQSEVCLSWQVIPDVQATISIAKLYNNSGTYAHCHQFYIIDGLQCSSLNSGYGSWLYSISLFLCCKQLSISRPSLNPSLIHLPRSKRECNLGALKSQLQASSISHEKSVAIKPVGQGKLHRKVKFNGFLAPSPILTVCNIWWWDTYRLIVFIHWLNITFVHFKLVGTPAAKQIRVTCAVLYHKLFVVLTTSIAVPEAWNALLMARPARQAFIRY